MNNVYNKDMNNNEQEIVKPFDEYQKIWLDDRFVSQEEYYDHVKTQWESMQIISKDLSKLETSLQVTLKIAQWILIPIALPYVAQLISQLMDILSR